MPGNRRISDEFPKVMGYGLEKDKFPVKRNAALSSQLQLLRIFWKTFTGQFHKAINIFYILLLILHAFENLPEERMSAYFATWFIAIAVSVTREFLELVNLRDRCRRDDNRVCFRFLQEEKRFAKIRSGDITNGDIIEVAKGETVPCDLLIVLSSNSGRQCWVDVNSTSGRNKNELRTIVPNLCQTIFGLTSASGIVRSTLPGREFEARITPTQHSSIALRANKTNCLFKGERLVATDFVAGLAVFVGDECRSVGHVKQLFRRKYSRIESAFNSGIVFLSILMFFLAILQARYRELQFVEYSLEEFTLSFVHDEEFSGSVGAFLWILGQHAPMSISIVMDLIWLILWIKVDRSVNKHAHRLRLVNKISEAQQAGNMHLYNKLCAVAMEKWGKAPKDLMTLRSTAINAMGEIGFAFFDKTGTLTDNHLVVKRLSVGATCYGDDEGDAGATAGAATAVAKRRLSVVSDVAALWQSATVDSYQVGGTGLLEEEEEGHLKGTSAEDRLFAEPKQRGFKRANHSMEGILESHPDFPMRDLRLLADLRSNRPTADLIHHLMLCLSVCHSVSSSASSGPNLGTSEFSDDLYASENDEDSSVVPTVDEGDETDDSPSLASLSEEEAGEAWNSPRWNQEPDGVKAAYSMMGSAIAQAYSRVLPEAGQEVGEHRKKRSNLSTASQLPQDSAESSLNQLPSSNYPISSGSNPGSRRSSINSLIEPPPITNSRLTIETALSPGQTAGIVPLRQGLHALFHSPTPDGEGDRLVETGRTDERSDGGGFPDEILSGRVAYHASSKVEMALITAARCLGYCFKGRHESKLLISVNGEDIEFVICAINHSEERTSVLVQAPDANFYLYCRGTAHGLLPRIKDCSLGRDVAAVPPEFDMDQTQLMILVDQAVAAENVGMQCVFGAVRKLERDDALAWLDKYMMASSTAYRAKEELQLVASEIEVELELLGIVAIEERLSEAVKPTLRFMEGAGIRPWIVTGDVMSSAQATARNCDLINHKTQCIQMFSTDKQSLMTQLERIQSQLRQSRMWNSEEVIDEIALFISGPALQALSEWDLDTISPTSWKLVSENTSVFQNSIRFRWLFRWLPWRWFPWVTNFGVMRSPMEMLIDLMIQCRCCIGVQFEPHHKSELVKYLRELAPNSPSVLAVGDGFNDIPMLQAADVGIAVGHGCKRGAVVAASDFSLTNMSLLKDLMLYHGKRSSISMHKVVNYAFFKTALILAPDVLFNVNNASSGMPLAPLTLRFIFDLVWIAFFLLISALSDKHSSREFLFSYPQVYRDSTYSKASLCQFVGSLLKGGVIGSVVYWTVFAFPEDHAVDGQSAGFEVIAPWLAISLAFLSIFEFFLRTEMPRIRGMFLLLITMTGVMLTSVYSEHVFDTERQSAHRFSLDDLVTVMVDCPLLWVSMILPAILLWVLTRGLHYFRVRWLPRPLDILQIWEGAMIGPPLGAEVLTSGRKSREKSLGVLHTLVSSEANSIDLNRQHTAIMEQIEGMISAVSSQVPVERKGVGFVDEQPFYRPEALVNRFTAKFVERRIEKRYIEEYMVTDAVPFIRLTLWVVAICDVVYAIGSWLVESYECDVLGALDLLRVDKCGACRVVVFHVCAVILATSLVPFGILMHTGVFRAYWYRCTVIIGALMSLTLAVFVESHFAFAHFLCQLVVWLVIRINFLPQLCLSLANVAYFVFKSTPDTTNPIMVCFVFVEIVFCAVVSYHTHRLQREDFAQRCALESSEADARGMLVNLMPPHVTNRIWEGGSVADNEECVTIAFVDIVNFQVLIQKRSVYQVVEFLDKLWSLLDELCAKYDIRKIETVGKTYMACSGLQHDHSDHAKRTALWATEVLLLLGYFIREETSPNENGSPQPGFPTTTRSSSSTRTPGSVRTPNSQKKSWTNAGYSLEVRCGIHTGSVVAGVVGDRKPQYCLFGDTVNTASRIQSTGLINHVNVSASTYNLIQDQFVVAVRQVEAKGKGTIDSYVLLSPVQTDLRQHAISKRKNAAQMKVFKNVPVERRPRLRRRHAKDKKERRDVPPGLSKSAKLKISLMHGDSDESLLPKVKVVSKGVVKKSPHHHKSHHRLLPRRRQRSVSHDFSNPGTPTGVGDGDSFSAESGGSHGLTREKSSRLMQWLMQQRVAQEYAATEVEANDGSEQSSPANSRRSSGPRLLLKASQSPSRRDSGLQGTYDLLGNSRPLTDGDGAFEEEEEPSLREETNRTEMLVELFESPQMFMHPLTLRFITGNLEAEFAQSQRLSRQSKLKLMFVLMAVLNMFEFVLNYFLEDVGVIERSERYFLHSEDVWLRGVCSILAIFMAAMLHLSEKFGSHYTRLSVFATTRIVLTAVLLIGLGSFGSNNNHTLLLSLFVHMCLTINSGGLMFIFALSLNLFFAIIALVDWSFDTDEYFFFAAVMCVSTACGYTWEYHSRHRFLLAVRTRKESHERDQMLYRMLPENIIKQLKVGARFSARVFDDTSLLFTDICSFTLMCSQLRAEQVVTVLNELFGLFDALTRRYKVFKVQTIGDAYVIASGFPDDFVGSKDSAIDAAKALSVLTESSIDKLLEEVKDLDAQFAADQKSSKIDSSRTSARNSKAERKNLLSRVAKILEKIEDRSLAAHMIDKVNAFNDVCGNSFQSASQMGEEEGGVGERRFRRSTAGSKKAGKAQQQQQQRRRTVATGSWRGRVMTADPADDDGTVESFVSFQIGTQTRQRPRDMLAGRLKRSMQNRNSRGATFSGESSSAVSSGTSSRSSKSDESGRGPLADVDDITRKNARMLAMCAQGMLRACGTIKNPATGKPLEIRVGLHFGEVICGVVGRRTLRFDIWGTDVLIGACMESGGIPGQICASSEFESVLREEYEFKPHKPITVKGYGNVDSFIMREAKLYHPSDGSYTPPPGQGTGPLLQRKMMVKPGRTVTVAGGEFSTFSFSPEGTPKPFRETREI